MTRNPRTELINCLLDLAAFLETHPDLPVSSSITAHHFAQGDSDLDLQADIDRIAARTGTPIDFEDSPYGHYATLRAGRVPRRGHPRRRPRPP
ncbi:hypothetical protein AB0L05_35680 [Nonomuraea pusilla]|uniref:hypothetical protein n=1 Tax=Nonomuraea pusilla TaxID=46177 RepID=UPI00332D3E87